MRAAAKEDLKAAVAEAMGRAQASAEGVLCRKAEGLKGRWRGEAEFLVGHSLRVEDGVGGDSYHEGVVIGIEALCGSDGVGECLKMLVRKRVVDGVERAVTGSRLLMIDMSIPMRRVTEVRGVALVEVAESDL